MRADFLDRHSRLDSAVHRLPAGYKAAGSLFLLLLLALLPPLQYWWPIAIAALLLGLLAASRVPLRFVATRLLLLEPFALAVGVLALLQENGSERFLWIAIRSTLSLLIVILLSSTTPFHELLAVLRRLRAPAVIVSTVAMMYRYLFILSDEVQRKSRARRSRSFGARASRGWLLPASTAGQLFLRSMDRADRVYQAMTARGWR
jgi:cobalt/nickel transport system permease protein